ncbi:Immediate Early Response 5 Protein [Manis pentadactyla]|nr:Immediate Early Response 5 Protein [Manis pentadactyla]
MEWNTPSKSPRNPVEDTPRGARHHQLEKMKDGIRNLASVPNRLFMGGHRLVWLLCPAHQILIRLVEAQIGVSCSPHTWEESTIQRHTKECQIPCSACHQPIVLAKPVTPESCVVPWLLQEPVDVRHCC